MENLNEHELNELEAMRGQMQILRQKLQDQELVNDRLLRNAMSNKMSWVTKYIWFELWGLFPLCVLVFSANKMLFPSMSWYPTLVILALTFVDVLIDLYVNRVSARDWQSENLLQTADKLLRMKKLRWVQLAVSIPLLVGVFWWYLAEFPSDVRLFITAGGVIGGVIGLAVGVSILLKMQRINDSLIRQIREMRSDGE